MNFLTWGTDPYGQEVLIRISWDLLYLASVLGVLFVIAHAVWLTFLAPKPATVAVDEAQAANVPAQVARHSLAARAFHWIMAVAMLVLLFTGFLPVIGIQFPWVTMHWIAGVVLTLSIIYHVIHASFWLDLWSMWIGPKDVDDAMRRFKRSIGQDAPPPRKHAKYPLENRLYHHVIVLSGGLVMITGILMMFRIETPLWARDPYIFADPTWGMIYVVHGLSSVSLVTLVIAHIYFGLRPEKRWITWGMIRGWIDRRDYLEHHDPEQWAARPEEGSSQR